MQTVMPGKAKNAEEKVFKFLITDIWHKFKNRSLSFIFLTFLNGILEGFAMVLLFPLLALIGIGDFADDTKLNQIIQQFFSFLHLEQSLPAVLLVIISAFILQNGVFIIQSYMSAKLQSEYESKLRREYFSSVLDADYNFFKKGNDGEIINTIFYEATRISTSLTLLSQIISVLILTAVYVATALICSWQLTVLLLATAGVLSFSTKILLVYNKKIGKKLTYFNEKIVHYATEVFAGVKQIKVNCAEKVVKEKFNSFATNYAKNNFYNYFSPPLAKSAFEATAIISLILILVYAIKSLHIDVASTLLVLALFFRLYPRIANFQYFLQQFYINTSAILSYKNNVLAARANKESDTGDKIITSKLPTISFINVAKNYGDLRVLKDINLTFSPGAITAIVGKSGAGKSTLIDSLLKLIPIDSGDIIIDGISVRDLATYQFRKQIAYVTQDSFLFNDTVLYNVTFGLKDYEEAQVINALKKANAYDFVMAKGGLLSQVTDRGSNYSNGQRQRLMLARALLMQAKILILDEATSALDAHSEKLIIEEVVRLKQNMTIIMIAHRFSSIKNADYIYVLDNGRVVEDGSWAELSKKTGEFERLRQMQELSG